ncbi:hypothetical protein L6Q21_09515 [Sandaracinobacter sp. RS1-74]|uniref:hypothetical protein n=1 Tax=Sandaracinobacteroides sayramensis TaxID=2913411 RepID=UPI001EDA4F13|nr:hypothetical protein [Sandaracinobacteroides sayramensis]MCG2841216.1 hypothetical protein [Sandaracinobacteroides sayramensis]
MTIGPVLSHTLAFVAGMAALPVILWTMMNVVLFLIGDEECCGGACRHKPRGGRVFRRGGAARTGQPPL